MNLSKNELTEALLFVLTALFFMKKCKLTGQDVPDDHHDQHCALVLDRDTFSDSNIPQRYKYEQHT